jgi:hypothetical protein
MIGVDYMLRGIWFELNETGRLILWLTIFALLLVAGLAEFINWIRKK